jgi:hypothetical protein
MQVSGLAVLRGSSSGQQAVLRGVRREIVHTLFTGSGSKGISSGWAIAPRVEVVHHHESEPLVRSQTRIREVRGISDCDLPPAR